MKIQGAFVRGLAGLLATLAAAGCATSGPRSRYLERIAPDSVSHLAAYRAGNTLEISYPLGRKDAFAHAAWNPVASSAGAYQYQFAVLTFDKEKRAVRKSI